MNVGAGRHESQANRAAVRTVVTAYDARGPIVTRLAEDGSPHQWGIRGGVPEAAEEERAEARRSDMGEAALAAIEAEERMMAYA